MKRILLFALILFSLDTLAQSLELTPYYGYRVGGRIDVYSGPDLGYVRFRDSESFGLDLNYELRTGMSVNLAWYGQSTFVDFYGYNNAEIQKVGDSFVNYFMLSGIYEKQHGGITPFAGLGLGAATTILTDPKSDVVVRFAASLQGGAKFDLSERIGLRIKAAMLMPLQFGSGGLFCGIGTGGSGCSVNVGASSSILQGDFSAGLIVKLGDSNSQHGKTPSSSPTW